MPAFKNPVDPLEPKPAASLRQRFAAWIAPAEMKDAPPAPTTTPKKKPGLLSIFGRSPPSPPPSDVGQDERLLRIGIRTVAPSASPRGDTYSGDRAYLPPSD